MVCEGGGDQRSGADGAVRVLHHARARNHLRPQGPLRPRGRRRRHHVDESVGAPAPAASCAVHPVVSAHWIGARRRPQRCGVPLRATTPLQATFASRRCPGFRTALPRRSRRVSARKSRIAISRSSRKAASGSAASTAWATKARRFISPWQRRSTSCWRALKNSPGVVARHCGAACNRVAARLARGVAHVTPAAPPCRRRAGRRSIRLRRAHARAFDGARNRPAEQRDARELDDGAALSRNQRSACGRAQSGSPECARSRRDDVARGGPTPRRSISSIQRRAG